MNHGGDDSAQAPVRCRPTRPLDSGVMGDGAGPSTMGKTGPLDREWQLSWHITQWASTVTAPQSRPYLRAVRPRSRETRAAAIRCVTLRYAEPGSAGTPDQMASVPGRGRPSERMDFPTSF